MKTVLGLNSYLQIYTNELKSCHHSTEEQV